MEFDAFCGGRCVGRAVSTKILLIALHLRGSKSFVLMRMISERDERGFLLEQSKIFFLF